MELWEIAAILGRNVSDEEQAQRDGKSFNQRRAEQLERERPSWMGDGGALSETELAAMRARIPGGGT